MYNISNTMLLNKLVISSYKLTLSKSVGQPFSISFYLSRFLSSLSLSFSLLPFSGLPAISCPFQRFDLY